MEISLGDFRITSDPTCFTLSVLTQPKDKSKDSYHRTIGYYTRLKDLFEAIPDRGLMDSDAKTVKEIIAWIARYTAIVANIDTNALECAWRADIQMGDTKARGKRKDAQNGQPGSEGGANGSDQ